MTEEKDLLTVAYTTTLKNITYYSYLIKRLTTFSMFLNKSLGCIIGMLLN